MAVDGGVELVDQEGRQGEHYGGDGSRVTPDVGGEQLCQEGVGDHADTHGVSNSETQQTDVRYPYVGRHV